MTEKIDQEKITAGRTWAENEMRNLAIERTVKINSIHWNESPPDKVWIATVDSAAGEHTIALSYTSLALCADEGKERLSLREKLRGLIGDLARIERRGYLR